MKRILLLTTLLLTLNSVFSQCIDSLTFNLGVIELNGICYLEGDITAHTLNGNSSVDYVIVLSRADGSTQLIDDTQCDFIDLSGDESNDINIEIDCDFIDIAVQYQGYTNPMCGGTSCINDVVLPVQLEYFNGQIHRNRLNLYWQTSHATNSSHFEIERSFTGDVFETIFTQQTYTECNNSTCNYNSSFLFNRSAYFRLKHVDLDGTYQYSDILYFNYDQDIVVYNSTFNDNSLLVVNESNHDQYYTITDFSGRILQKGYILIGTNNIAFNTFQNGLYLIEIDKFYYQFIKIH